MNESPAWNWIEKLRGNWRENECERREEVFVLERERGWMSKLLRVYIEYTIQLGVETKTS